MIRFPEPVLNLSNRAIRLTIVLALVIAGSVFSHAAEIGLDHDHHIDIAVSADVLVHHTHAETDESNKWETLHCGADITSLVSHETAAIDLRRNCRISHAANHFWQLSPATDTPPPRYLLG